MVGPSITRRRVKVDFLTSSYRITGEAQVGNAGFTALLNDESTSLIEVFLANLARAQQPAKPVDIYEVVRLVKTRIMAVCLNKREDVGMVTLGRGAYSTIAEIPINLTTTVYEVQGTVEWAGHFDFASLMAEGGREFIPLYDVKLTMVLVPTVLIECEAAFINRRYIQTLALLRQRQKWE
jgi:hypothetical protein